LPKSIQWDLPSRGANAPWRWHRIKSAFLLVVGASSLSLSAFAADSVLVQTNCYRVTGQTVREIRRSINAARPWKGHTTDALTKWQVTWSYTTRASGDGVELLALQTKTTIVITLPRWQPAEPVTDAALWEEWNGYLRALLIHEDGHKQIGLAAAVEVRQHIRAAGRSNTHAQLGAEINRVGQAVLTDFRKRDLAYDQKTQHGLTQGARFPKARERAKDAR
jgi:predicted secreted Zn-dependent protease